jgi:hypothetical protein
MTLQSTPIVVLDGYVDDAGNPLRDLPFLGPANTELPVFRLRPTLDSEGFQVAMIWLQLSGQWLARQLLTRDGSKVTLGIPLTGSGVDLTATITSKANAPAGQLWYAFDDGRTGAPQRDDWRGTASLYYRPAALVSQLRGTDRALL